MPQCQKQNDQYFLAYLDAEDNFTSWWKIASLNKNLLFKVTNISHQDICMV